MNYTPEDLDRLQTLADAATEGPWKIALFRRDGYCGRIDSDKPWTVDGCTSLFSFERDEDARFVEATRTAIPALIADLREARAEIERVRALECRVRWALEELKARSRNAVAAGDASDCRAATLHYPRAVAYDDAADLIRTALEGK